MNMLKLIEEAMANGQSEFKKMYETTDIFEMSFTRGETFVVRALGWSEESTEDDPKVDVVVLSQHGKPWSKEWSHQIGEKRWVRTYDLKATEATE